MNLNIGYISYEDFLDRFSEELINLGSADTPIEDDIDVIQKCILDGSNQIDLYLTKVYDVIQLRNLHHPFLKRICADLTYFFLLKRKGIAKDIDRKNYYDPNIKTLESLANNDLSLYGVTRVNKDYKSNEVSYIFDKEKFTDNTLRAFEDIEN